LYFLSGSVPLASWYEPLNPPNRQQLSRLGPVLPASCTWSDPARKLQLSEYLSLFLFALVNPILATTRALCAASDLSRVQRELCGRSVSLGPQLMAAVERLVRRTKVCGRGRGARYTISGRNHRAPDRS